MSIYGVSSSTTSGNMSAMLAQLRKARQGSQESDDFATSFISDKDTDGDSQLSLGETDFSEEQFSSIDSDADGYLSAEELTTEEKRRQQQGELNMSMQGLGQSSGSMPSASDLTSKLIANLDADSDGMLNLEETGMDEDSFNAIDSDGDGSLSADEITSDIESHMEEMQAAMQAANGQGVKQTGTQSTSSDSDGEDEEYDELDLNEDGTVSAAELRQAVMSGLLDKSSVSGMEDFSSVFGAQDSTGSNGSTGMDRTDSSSYMRKLADQAYMSQMMSESAASQGITV